MNGRARIVAACRVNEDRMADLLFLALGLAAFVLFGVYAAALRRL
jgi:hypothetical protein